MKGATAMNNKYDAALTKEVESYSKILEAHHQKMLENSDIGQRFNINKGMRENKYIITEKELKRFEEKIAADIFKILERLWK